MNELLFNLASYVMLKTDAKYIYCGCYFNMQLDFDPVYIEMKLTWEDHYQWLRVPTETSPSLKLACATVEEAEELAHQKQEKELKALAKRDALNAIFGDL